MMQGKKGPKTTKGFANMLNKTNAKIKKAVNPSDKVLTFEFDQDIHPDFEFKGDLMSIADIDDPDKTTSIYRGTFTLPVTFDENGQIVKYKIALRGGNLEGNGTMRLVIDNNRTIVIRRETDSYISPNSNDNTIFLATR